MTVVANLECEIVDNLYQYYRSTLYSAKVKVDCYNKAMKLLAVKHLQNNTDCDITLTMEYNLLLEKYEIDV